MVRVSYSTHKKKKMKKGRLRRWISNNPLVKRLYRGLFYLEVGKQQYGRLQFINELFIVIGGIKYLLGVDLQPVHVVVIVGIAFASFVIIGFLTWQTGLFDVEQKTMTQKNPIMRRIYEAANKYLEEHKNDKKKTKR